MFRALFLQTVDTISVPEDSWKRMELQSENTRKDPTWCTANCSVWSRVKMTRKGLEKEVNLFYKPKPTKWNLVEHSSTRLALTGHTSAGVVRYWCGKKQWRRQAASGEPVEDLHSACGKTYHRCQEPCAHHVVDRRCRVLPSICSQAKLATWVCATQSWWICQRC